MKRISEVTLYVGYGEDKEKITLYDFIKISHICKEGRAYLEVVTSIKTYLFPSQLTAISEVKINED